jgi:hypothetical protein
MRWEQFEKCPLCGGSDFALYKTSGVNCRLPELPNTTLYYFRCKCGLIFQNPRLDEQSVMDYYASGQYRRSVLGSVTNQDESEIKRQKSILPLLTGSSLLDVGCSRGSLLQMAKEKNMAVMGVEPYSEYVVYPVPTVRTIDDVQGKYDTVTCIEVLEHISNPVEFAGKLMDRTETRLIVEVPSKESPGGPWRLPHIFYFTDAIIEKIFGRMRLLATIKTPASLFVFEWSV